MPCIHVRYMYRISLNLFHANELYGIATWHRISTIRMPTYIYYWTHCTIALYTYQYNTIACQSYRVGNAVRWFWKVLVIVPLFLQILWHLLNVRVRSLEYVSTLRFWWGWCQVVRRSLSLAVSCRWYRSPPSDCLIETRDKRVERELCDLLCDPLKQQTPTYCRKSKDQLDNDKNLLSCSNARMHVPWQ